MKKYKIFISGVQKELKEERRTIKKFYLSGNSLYPRLMKSSRRRPLLQIPKVAGACGINGTIRSSIIMAR